MLTKRVGRRVVMVVDVVDEYDFLLGMGEKKDEEEEEEKEDGVVDVVEKCDELR